MSSQLPAEQFSNMLTEALYKIKSLESKSLQVIQDEIGFALGRDGGTAIAYWRQRHIPAKRSDFEQLADELARRAELDEAWRKAFAGAAGFDFGSQQKGRTFAQPNLEKVDNHVLGIRSSQSRLGLDDIEGLNENESPLLKLPIEAILKPSPLPQGSYLPFSPNPLFVGREAIFSHLVDKLQQTNTVAIGQTVAMMGLGGLGKTQLVIEFAHRYGRYFPGGIFWFNFEQPDTIATQFASCGGLDRMSLRPDFNEFSLAEQVKIVQTAWQRKVPRLLIFDGCEDEATLLQWRPTHGGCRIILTSRKGRWSPGLGVAPLPLERLKREASVKLLQKFQSIITIEEADSIAAELGDLPLALHLAGSFLATYGFEVTPKEYLEQLRLLSGGNLLEHPSLQGLGADFSPTDHELHVARSFALSYDQLDSAKERDALAQIILLIATYFAPNEPIPRSMLVDSVSKYNHLETEPQPSNLSNSGTYRFLIADSLRRLEALGLIQVGLKGDVRLHKLVAEFTQGVGQDEDVQTAVEETLIIAAKDLNELNDVVRLRPWHSHLQYATERAAVRSDVIGAKLANEWGCFLYSIADYNQAQAYLESALNTFKQVVGTNNLNTASCFNRLGVLLGAKSDYERARPYLEQALDIYERLLGNDHVETSRSLNHLGTLTQNTGDYEKSLAYFNRALNIKKKVLGDSHPETAQCMNNLGLVLQATGDFVGAEIYYEQTLKIYEKEFGTEHSETAKSLNNLGALMQAQGDFERARRYYERSLSIKEKVLGSNHPSTARSLNNLGGFIGKTGNLEDALPLFKKALAIRQEVLGIGHPDTAMNLNNIGGLLDAMGDSEGSQKYLELAITSFEQALGNKHPKLAYPLNNLGMLYKKSGRLNEAHPYLEQALIIRHQSLGTEHPLTAQSYSNLGGLLQLMGKQTQAQANMEKALAIQKEKLGIDHPQTATTLHNLGSLFHVMGRLEQAEQNLKMALSIREQRFGSEHLDTGETLYRLGTLYQAMGNLEAAIPCLAQALKIFEKSLGKEHEKSQIVRANLYELEQEDE